MNSWPFHSLINKKTAEVLKEDDPGGGAFALFLRPPGHLDSLCVPAPGNLPIFFFKKKC